MTIALTKPASESALARQEPGECHGQRARQNRAVATVAFACGLVIASTVGCNSRKSTGSTTGAGGSNSKTSAPGETLSSDRHAGDDNQGAHGLSADLSNGAALKTPLDGWEKPALALVLTGQQYGYFEPCGCSELQSGGVYRRADLVEKIEKKGWPVAALDLGGNARRTRRHSEIKFDTLLDALRDMRYKAVGLGPQDIAFGAAYLLSKYTGDPDDPEVGLPFVAANVVLFDTPDLPQGPLPARVFTVGGVKIGVTSILSPAFEETTAIAENNPDLSVLDPKSVLPGAIAQLKEQKPDLMVLLSHADLETTRDLAKEFDEFDLILSAGGPEDPDNKPMRAGKAMLLNVGHKGKYTGVVGYYPGNSDARFRFELVDLDKERFEDNLKMVAHLRNYQSRLHSEKIAGNAPEMEHPSGATYVGAEACAECHPKAYEKWVSTRSSSGGHAYAFESLKGPRKGHADHGISRIYDTECLVCHVTGWHPQEIIRYKSGFINEEYARNDEQREMFQLLRGVQCENCHGPASRHIELVGEENFEAARKEVHVSLKVAKEKLCYECHDDDNSPHFDFDTYWEQIEHPWLD